MEKIKYIFFDLDDTLLTSRVASLMAYKKVYKKFKPFRIVSEDKFLNICKEAKREYINDSKYTTYPRYLFWKKIIDKLHICVEIVDIVTVINMYWNAILENIETYEGALNLLKTLKRDGYYIGIITSGDFLSKARKLISCHLDKYIDGLFPTELVISDKSTGEIYQYVLDSLNVKATGCVMVGDVPDQDATPAKKIGFTTVLGTMRYGGKELSDTTMSSVDYSISSLDKLLNVLERINNERVS